LTRRHQDFQFSEREADDRPRSLIILKGMIKMRQGQVSATDREVQRSIVRLLQERERLYGWVAGRTFLSRNRVGEDWARAATRIEVLYKEDEKPEELRWEYDHGMLVKFALFQDEFVRMLDALIEKGQLNLPGNPPIEVNLEGGFMPGEYLPSKGWGFAFPWPANFYQFGQHTPAYPSQRPFISRHAPAFTDFQSLIHEQVGLKGTGSLVIFLPNYVARIENLKLSSQRLTVHVKTQNLSFQSLLAKVHLTDNRGAQSVHCDLAFQQEAQFIPLNFPLGQVYIGLLSKEHGELLDFRQFHRSWLGSASAPEDVELEPIVEEEIEALILQGESERVEFKVNLAYISDLKDERTGR